MRSALPAAVLAGLMVMAGCDSSNSPVPNPTLTLSSRYTTEVIAPATSLPKSGALSVVDSVVLTRARIIIRNIKFKSTADSLNFKTSPVLLDLNLTGIPNDIAVADVPTGTYRKIKFKVHRIEQPDLAGMTAEQQASFADFLAGERYSIILEGTAYPTGSASAPFTYRSKLDAEQEYNIVPEMVITESTASANVTLKVSSAEWFRASNGALLDPRDPANDSQIDNNIKKSFKAFKDNDRNGRED